MMLLDFDSVQDVVPFGIHAQYEMNSKAIFELQCKWRLLNSQNLKMQIEGQMHRQTAYHNTAYLKKAYKNVEKSPTENTTKVVVVWS